MQLTVVMLPILQVMDTVLRVLVQLIEYVPKMQYLPSSHMEYLSHHFDEFIRTLMHHDTSNQVQQV